MKIIMYCISIMFVGLALLGCDDSTPSEGFSISVIEGKWQSTTAFSDTLFRGFEFQSDGTGRFGSVDRGLFNELSDVTATVYAENQIRVGDIPGTGVITLYVAEDLNSFQTNGFVTAGVVTFTTEAVSF
jgi:hypothetical protein